jgi:predicted metal-binding membrane protein
MSTFPALGQQQRVGPPRVDGATIATGGLVVVVAGLAWLGVAHPTSWMAAGANVGVLAGATPYVLAWGVMMAAMMLPSAAPTIVLYTGMRRNAARAGNRGVGGVAFAAVYVALWLAFGLPVYAIERTVAAAAAGSHQVATLLPYGAALTLAAAGVYQFTPLKKACLTVCQHPFAFLLARWRDGYLGSLGMAWQHALYCIGCCWGLMIVLVAAGAMSLPWVLLITAVVVAEKFLPDAPGDWVARLVGVGLLVAGLAIAIHPQFVTGVPGMNPGMQPNMKPNTTMNMNMNGM